jgi:preprotein translocase subunit SecE
MAMNREQRRLSQKMGVTGPDGEPVRTRSAPPKPVPAEERATAAQFVREVRGELRKVAWPTREETINYTSVVLVTLVIITALVFGLDWVFAKGTEALFHP